MSQFSYVPGDSRLVDHIIGELKSKGIFDQFRKECISDVDTKPAYQNLRLRVEGSVSAFLSRQRWKPDLNKNQLREKLRKHIHEANYLEQGVERIVDQVVNPKVSSVFIPQVEDLVYSYLGIQKPKTSQNSNTQSNSDDVNNGIHADLEAVSPESIKSQETKMEVIENYKHEDDKMEVDEIKEEKDEQKSPEFEPLSKTETSSLEVTHDSNDSKSDFVKDNFKEELIVTTELSNLSIDIPFPDDPPKITSKEESSEFKQSDTETSLDSAIIRNVSPLTPVHSFNNENSCDAQPAFDERTTSNSLDTDKKPDTIPISTFRFTIEKDCETETKLKKSENVENSISYNYEQKVLNCYSAVRYDDSSSSNNLHIDYQSDKDGTTLDGKPEQELKTESGIVSIDEHAKKDHTHHDKKKSHKSSHSSRDHKHSSSSKQSKDRRSDYKYPSNDKKESSRSDRKSSRDDSAHGRSRHSSHRDRSKDRNDRENKESSERKDKGGSSKDRHSPSHKSSSSKDSKTVKHSSSSSRHHSSSSGKHSSEKKCSSSRVDNKKDDKSHHGHSKSSKDHSRHSSSHRSDKDKYKSSTSKDRDKENKKDDKKDKKVNDDHYSASGRGNRTRRSTDRDSNDGNSSSSKGSNFLGGTKSAAATLDNKSSTSKSENQTSGNDSTSQSDAIEKNTLARENYNINNNTETSKQLKPVLQLDSKLKTPVLDAPPILIPSEVMLRKPMIAANMTEALKLMKVRKQLAAEQEKKRQEAALLLEFQEKIHSSISQVYSGISGPELEFACIPKYTTTETINVTAKILEEEIVSSDENTNDKGANKAILEKNIATKDITADIETTKDLNDIQEPLEEDYLNFVYGDPSKEPDLHYFTQQEVFNAELQKDCFAKFYNSLEKVETKITVFLLNCDFHHEHIFQQLYEENDKNYCIVNINQVKPKSGPSKLRSHDLTKTEVILPNPAIVNQNERDASIVDYYAESNLYTFSPSLSSDCSLDLSYDYEKKIDEIMLSKSRKEVMEIILGEVAMDSPTYYIQDGSDNEAKRANLKRKCNGLIEDHGSDNNNHKVLVPRKIRRLSISEQISSTTEGQEADESPKTFKSKFIGKAHRVGLSKPKNVINVTMSPLSDKSVENYVQNDQTEKSPKLNGSVKDKLDGGRTKRAKVAQRYDTSDLYKPKLHYLSKRHSNVT